MYVGRRRRTRDVLQRRMYVSEVTQWMLEADRLDGANELAITEEGLINARLITA